MRVAIFVLTRACSIRVSLGHSASRTIQTPIVRGVDGNNLGGALPVICFRVVHIEKGGARCSVARCGIVDFWCGEAIFWDVGYLSMKCEILLDFRNFLFLAFFLPYFTFDIFSLFSNLYVYRSTRTGGWRYNWGWCFFRGWTI